MKVLEITTCWHGGGAESVARDLNEVMVGHGIDCYYAYSRGKVPHNVKGYKIEKKHDVLAHFLIARLFDLNGRGGKQATKKLLLLIEKIKPDIVHIHNIVGYVLNIEILFNYLKEKGINIVWTFHDCWPFTGHCICFEDIGCKKWVNGCFECKKIRQYPKSLFVDNSRDNWICKRDLLGDGLKLTIVTPSVWMKSNVEKSFFNRYPCVVINNGIDLGVFRPMTSDIRSQYEIHSRKIILAVAGSWNDSKGFKHLLELDDILDRDEHILVVIGVTKKQKKEFKKDTICIEKTNNVYELVRWYTVADVFINPTLSDNFPTVNIEALACGTPIVAYNTGGISEQISNKVGVLVENKNPRSLYDAVKTCIGLDICEEECIDSVRKYDKWIRYQEYIKLYREII